MSLKNKLYSEIDTNSERKKREVDYILEIIEDSEYNPKLIELFGKNEDGKFSESYLEKKVFDGAKKSIESIREYASNFGIRTFRGSLDKIEIPVYSLGWIEAKKFPEGDNLPLSGCYSLQASEKGLEILNRFKEIRGELSIKEENKIRNDFLFARQ